MYRKIIVAITLSLLSMVVFAQKDVTKFLGIPVDGTKTEMLNKIKAKGFVPSSLDKDILEGEFNGKDVYVSVATNGNKVRRVMVKNQRGYSEYDARLQFNILCKQFMNNSRYISFSELEDLYIPEDDDMDYQMVVNKKRYQASFNQVLDMDSTTLQNQMAEALYSRYTEEQIQNASDEQKKEMIDFMIAYGASLIDNKSVWFMLDKYAGEYYILLFYDNKYNEAHGEDL